MPDIKLPLTDEEIRRIDDETMFHESPEWSLRFARAIERAHGIGNEARATLTKPSGSLGEDV